MSDPEMPPWVAPLAVEYTLQEVMLNSMVSKVMLDGRGFPTVVKYKALQDAWPEFNIQEARDLLCAALVMLTVEREKP